MPKSILQSKASREEKWLKYLSDKTDSDIQRLLLCLGKNNPLWKEKEIAKRISGIFQFNSDRYHETSHELNDGIEVQIEKSTINAQIINMMVCMADAYGLKLTVV
jgi:hypothetical protein